MSRGQQFSEGFEVGRDLPPDYGTTPIPEGTVRFNHYTRPDAVPGIRQRGILRSKSEEKFAKGGTESPQVFATAGTPNDDLLDSKPVVEGWAHPDQLDIGRGSDPRDLEDRRNVITFRGDVPPEQIVAVHQHWHHLARYLETEPGQIERTLGGEHDHLLDDEHYGPAIQHIKNKYGAP